MPSTPAAFGSPLVTPRSEDSPATPNHLMANFIEYKQYMNPIGDGNANINNDLNSYGTGSNSQKKSQSAVESGNWKVYPQTNVPGVKRPFQPTQNNSVKDQEGNFKSLVYNLEDPDSSYTTPDIADFIRLDRAIYEGESMKKVQLIYNWLTKVNNTTV